jgi:hypothetical protein
LLDQPLKFSQLSAREPVIRGKLSWIQPELRFILSSLNVDMWWLFSLVAEKVKAKSAYPQHGGIGKFTGSWGI